RGPPAGPAAGRAGGRPRRPHRAPRAVRPRADRSDPGGRRHRCPRRGDRGADHRRPDPSAGGRRGGGAGVGETPDRWRPGGAGGGAGPHRQRCRGRGTGRCRHDHVPLSCPLPRGDGRNVRFHKPELWTELRPEGVLRMLKGFKEFLARGNIVDLAVAVVIGTAFTGLVTRFTDSVIQPLINRIGATGETDIGVLRIPIGGDQAIDLNILLSALINFVIVAAVVYFLVVLPYNKL